MSQKLSMPDFRLACASGVNVSWGDCDDAVQAAYADFETEYLIDHPGLHADDDGPDIWDRFCEKTADEFGGGK